MTQLDLDAMQQKLLEYNPNLAPHRAELASRIISALTLAGFTQRPPKHKYSELVFERAVGRYRICVYTSVIKPFNAATVRPKAKDAIRVAGVYRSNEGKEYGVLKQARVHRTGDMSAIVERMLERARSTYREFNGVPLCKHCSAPTFLSKKGNRVCAELCWKRGQK